MTNSIKILFASFNTKYSIEFENYIPESESNFYTITKSQTLQGVQGLLKNSKFDVIILDVSGSERTGEDLLNQILMVSKGIPVLVLSDSDDIKAGELAIKNGAADFIERKHLTSNVLERYIRFTLARESVKEYGGNKSPLTCLDKIMDESPFAMWISDSKGSIIKTNKSLCNALNLQDEQIIGKYNVFNDANLIENNLIPQIKTVFEKGNTIRSVIPWFAEKSGISEYASANDIWISFVMFPIVEHNGKTNHVVCQWIDVSEHKRMEDEILANEEKLRQIANNLPGAIYQFKIDNAGNFSMPYLSEGAESIFDRPLNELKEFANLLERLFPEDREGFIASIRESMNSMTPWLKEYRTIRKKDKSVQWIRGRSSPYKEPDGSIIWNGVMFDITAEKKAEAEQIKQQQKYKLLFNNMLDGYALHEIILDENGTPVDYRFLDVNLAFEKFTGLKKDDILGKRILEVLPNIEPFWIERYGHVALSGEPLIMEEFAKEFDKYFKVKAFSSDKGFFVTVIHDITEQKRIESELIETERKIKTLMSNLPGIAYQCKNDKAWTMNYISEGCFNLTGYKSHHLQDNNTISFADLIHPDDKNSVWEIIQKAVKKHSNYELEYRLITRKKSIKWVWERGLQVAIGDDGIGILEGFISDITERRKAEIDLMMKNKEYFAVNEELEESIQRVQNINIELEKAKTKAEESDNLKSAFLANMSHEIRTPLNGILGFSRILADKDLSFEKRQSYSKIIADSGDRLLQIINDIVDISKIEANQLSINNSECNIFSVFQSTFESYQYGRLLKSQPDIKLVLSVDDQYKNINSFTDHNRIQQVLDNLIFNAIKFTPSGKIEIGYTLKKRNKQDVIESFVKDTGIGIPKEKYEIIFQRFRQGEEIEYNSGSGLGLSISKGIVTLLGGEIWFTSAVNKGTSFYFSIPYNPITPILKLEKRPGEKDINLNGKRLIIAEDDLNSYFYLVELLSEYGLKIKHAENGLSLMNLLEHEVPDLILLDINMPLKSGYECMKDINNMKISTKIIAQTAYAMTNEKERCMKAGCHGYISKPIDKIELLKTIKRVMQAT